jgi:hypothetical protein
VGGRREVGKARKGGGGDNMKTTYKLNTLNKYDKKFFQKYILLILNLRIAQLKKE